MSPLDELIRQWLEKANDDLRLADMALHAQPPVIWAGAFHAQQAAEKLLKALLTAHRTEFQKYHSLDYLLDLLVPAEPKAEDLRAAASTLTDYAVEARYPFPRRESTLAEAREAVEIARSIRQFVLGRLGASHAFPGADARG